MTVLEFLSPRDPDRGYLSNFFTHAFRFDGQVWPTSEHAYQAQKTLDAGWRERIRTAATPRAAKNLGRSAELPQRADWEDVKLQAMLRVVAAKFCCAVEPGAELIIRLLATRDQRLVEASLNDSFWGSGADGQGHNHLGRVLMALRQSLLEADYLARHPDGDDDEETPLASSRLRDDEAMARDGEDAFHAWTVHQAWLRLSTEAWDPTTARPGLQFDILRRALLGQSIFELGDRLKPWMGQPVRVSVGARTLELSSVTPTVAGDDAAHPEPLRIHRRTWHRMGKGWQIELAQIDALTGQGSASTGTADAWNPPGPGLHWSLEGVFALPTPPTDLPFNPRQMSVPAATALALNFAVRNEDGEAAPGRSQLWVLDAAPQPEEPSIRPLPNGARWVLPDARPWQALALTPRWGGLPAIEDAYAREFKPFAMRLPLELVAFRQPSKEVDAPAASPCRGLHARGLAMVVWAG